MDLDPSLTGITLVLLVLAVGLALSFEFVNGFHDTANAVATVIYTNTLRPGYAVVWSGFWNFVGVLTSSGAVAFAVVQLLPVDLVLNIGSGGGFAMVFALLVSAIIWNLGTWSLGLPASSSHTLIGSILGVGLANSLMGVGDGDYGVNWGKARDVGAALLVSPMVGFLATALLFLLVKQLARNPALYRAPEGKKPPPPWIRGMLMFTCTGVSFAHGSNDGQKGMGLILLIIIGLAPASFALRMDADVDTLRALAGQSTRLAEQFEAIGAPPARTHLAIMSILEGYSMGKAEPSAAVCGALAFVCRDIATQLGSLNSLEDVPADKRGRLRTDIYLVMVTLKKLDAETAAFAAPAHEVFARGFRETALDLTEYIPLWVKVAVAFALGLGTMVGWKRIVVTIGERIGKSHMTYAQGMCAETVAMCTIFMADRLGLPVSTTHVLSSGVAGSMAANHSGLQTRTLRNILLAWVLTLPVCVFLGALLFALGLNLLFMMGIR